MLTDRTSTIEKSDENCYYNSRSVNEAGNSVTGSTSWDESCAGGKCSGHFSGTCTWTAPPSVLTPGTKQETEETAQVEGGQSCAYKHAGAWLSMYVNQVVMEPNPNVGWSTDEPKPAPVSVIVPWEVPWGKIGDIMTIEFYPHVTAVERGGIIYTYTYKASAPSTFNLPPDTRSSETFDPRSLKPRTGAYLTNLEGDVYVVRDREQILAKNGFQLRAEDVIIVPKDSEMCKLAWPGPEDPEKVYHETGIFDPGTEVILKPGSAVGIDEVAEERTRYLSRPKEVFNRFIEKNLDDPGVMYFLMVLTQGENEMKDQRYRERAKSEEEILKVEGKYGTAVSEHTQFICVETNSSSKLKVIEGEVRFISNVNSEEVRVNAGEMVIATSNGLSQPQAFDAKAEKASWGKYFPKTETPLSGFTNLEREIILASVWTVSESGPQGDYDGTWTRRPGTDTFDASWSGGSITDVIDITSVEGYEVSLYRHGNNGYYIGTISPDGTSISGTASWYVPEETWTASPA